MAERRRRASARKPEANPWSVGDDRVVTRGPLCRSQRGSPSHDPTIFKVLPRLVGVAAAEMYYLWEDIEDLLSDAKRLSWARWILAKVAVRRELYVASA